jgi:preprotein translocase subunit SecE
MATVSEDLINRSLFSELLTGSLYKPKQGRIVRQLTALAIWLACWLGGWQLSQAMGAWVTPSSAVTGPTFWSTSVYWLPLTLVAAGMWFAFRLVHWPRFADFLISVEAEMSKVSWPPKTELYRASMVVIFTMAFLAILLFCYDAFWQLLFDWLGVS